MPGRNGHRALTPQRPTLTQRLQAAQALLDRGFGRPKEVLEFVGDTTPEHERQARRARMQAMTDEERAELHTLITRASALMAPREWTPAPEIEAPDPTADTPR